MASTIFLPIESGFYVTSSGKNEYFLSGLRCAEKKDNSTPFLRGTQANALEWSYSFAADV